MVSILPFYAAIAGAIAVLNVYLGKKREKKRNRDLILSDIRRTLSVSVEDMQRFQASVTEHMDNGLEGNPNGMMMLPSFVDRLPTGDERGEYYAIDLGGTNLRVLWVRLGDKIGLVEDKEVRDWPIPEECFDTDNGLLMEWIADKLKEVASVHASPTSRIVVGFCFSFACKQKALNHGELLLWTKNFRGQGLLGKDVVQTLIEACEKRNLSVSIPALLNDTVATLIASRYKDPNTVAGVVLGTGTNCAYIESTDRIKALRKLTNDGKSQDLPSFDANMVVNTEWSDMIPEALPRCEEDLWVDFASNNPGRGLFEKLVSGLYIGEVCRRILYRLADKGGLFENCRLRRGQPHLLHALLQQNTLPAAAVAAIDHDESRALENVAEVLDEYLGIRNVRKRDLQTTQQVCQLVCSRASKLCAAALAAVMERCQASEDPVRVVAVDGSLFANYSAFRKRLEMGLIELVGLDVASNIKLVSVQDASAEGAAFLAAATSEEMN